MNAAQLKEHIARLEAQAAGLRATAARGYVAAENIGCMQEAGAIEARLPALREQLVQAEAEARATAT
jgi:hypothetical protein